jgi:hypothetical protein
MRIVKTTTDDFDQYVVTVERPLTWLEKVFRMNPIRVPVTNVLQADDETGLIIRQLQNEYGEALYSNGAEDIELSSTVRLLLLLPQVRDSFLVSGYRPKTEQKYDPSLRIIKSNGTKP